jgi:uncharacterized membrane protein YfhO
VKKGLRQKLRNWDTFAYAALFLSVVLMMVGIHGTGTIFGSMTDWVSQQSVIPEYFRLKFYETGNLFPDFAMSLGGGQNIYNLSYYGLLNPVILVSYLFPFVSMATYISFSSMILVIAAAGLCYRWLSSNGFSRKVAFVATICLVFAGPVILHSHRQTMFVEYLPFLILGLMGIDRYFKTGRTWLIVLGAFLCIMTSYFFSIGALLAMGLYGLFVSLGKQERFGTRRTVGDLLPVIGGILLAVLMSAVLWLPTLLVIFSERGGGNSIPLLSILLPTLPFNNLLVSGYSLGMTGISVFALAWAVAKAERNQRFLGIVLVALLIFPVFLYVLNGTLYLRAKALIPFLPLYVLTIAIFLGKLEKWIWFGQWKRMQNKKALFLVILCIVFTANTLNCVRANHGEWWVKTSDLKEYYSPSKISLIQQTLDKDKTFYRFNDRTFPRQTVNQTFGEGYNQMSIYTSTFNKAYNDFYYNIMHNPISTRNRVMCVSSNNVLFQDFMGVKYMISRGKVPAGYLKIAQKGDYELYRNDMVMPVGFATDNVINQADFGQIRFPNKMSALFSNIVTESRDNGKTSGSPELDPAFRKINLNPFLNSKVESRHVSIGKSGQVYYIHATAGATLTTPLNFDLWDNVLVLRFKIFRRSSDLGLDTSITVNGVKNKLSSPLDPYPNGNFNFVYVLSSNSKTTDLKFEFSPGYYQIRDLQAFTLPVTALQDAISKLDALDVDMKQTGDNRIAGHVSVSHDGYFATTIPYAKGFDITVDGKKQSYERVNTAFVGFPIDKGNHEIVLEFHAPGKTAGLLCSALGLLLYGLTLRRRRH